MKHKLLLILTLILSGTLMAQKVTLTGVVVDKKNGETLIGASVMQKGTTNGVITNLDGVFSLTISGETTLIVSYVGYISQEVQVKNNTKLNIQLIPDSKSLEELVVVGYGTKKAGAITGSVAQVKAADIIKTPAQSAIQSIQGKATGVSIIATDEPGKAPTVMIRGINTVLGGRSPLYVIDGVEATSMNGLSANDIETIDMLKDASSLAIYGNKAASGVILITTKKGKNGVVRVNYDANFGVKGMLKTIEMADAYHFAYYQNFASGRSKFDQNQPYNTNWLDEITRTGMTSNHSFSLSGGSNNVNYYFGASRYTEKGILKGTDFNRTNVISKNEYKLFGDKLKITQSINLSVTNNKPKPLSAFTAAYKQAPLMPVKYDNGKWAMPFLDDATAQIGVVGDKFNNVPNPVAMLDYNVEENSNLTLFGSVSAELKITKNLKYSSSFGATYDSGKGYTYTPNEENWWSQNPIGTAYTEPYYSTLQQRRSNFFTWNWDNYLTYSQIIGVHTLTGVLGMTRSTSRTSDYLSALRYNVPPQSNYWTLDLSKNDDKTAPERLISNNSQTPLVNVGYFARVDYDYKDKYLLTASIRRDGISDFQAGSKWGLFPAISAGWVMSSESFFEKYSSVVDYVKLRAGYGEIGNGNACPSVNQILFYNGATYTFGDSEKINPGSYVPNAVDPELTWETTIEFNSGMDLRFFRQRLSGTVDIYLRKTDNVILPVTIPSVLSPGVVHLNAGAVQNKGVETSWQWQDKIGQDFSYKIGGNFAYNKNEVADIYTSYFDKLIGGDLGNGHYTKEIHKGDPIGSFYVYETTGFDADGKFIYSSNRVNAGSYIPKYTYGFTFGFDYKNIDFSTDFYGVGGNKVYNGKKAQRWGGENVEMSELKDFWLPSAPDKSYKNPIPFNDTPWASTYYVEDGSFLRINNITIGYTVPKISKHISKIRLFITAINPFIITKYSGFSPELSGDNNGNPLTTAGIELNAYPTNKSLTMGINIGL